MMVEKCEIKCPITITQQKNNNNICSDGNTDTSTNNSNGCRNNFKLNIQLLLLS